MAWITRLTSSASFEPDNLKQVADVVGSDRQDLRRVGVRVEVDDGESVIEDVEDDRVRDAVSASRPMDLHIPNIVIRNCQEWNRSAVALGSRGNDLGFDKPARQVR